MRLRELVLGMALAVSMAASASAAVPAAQVSEAVEAVRTHPDLPGKRKEHTLRAKTNKETTADRPGHEWKWLRNLLRWLNESARLLVWGLGALGVALVAVGLRRWLRLRGGMAPKRPRPPPSHVQSLDIRPESLPVNIGGAAAQLWESGEHRAALSLLYRGALSRLVHGYAVAIHASSTEGECVQLVAERLDAERSAFFARLVAAWQLAVYAARLPESAQAVGLCSEFEAQLPAIPAPGRE